MKKLLNILKIALCLMTILGFIGCEQETPAPTPEKDYSAKVSVESIELESGGSTTFTVISKDGTWILDQNSVPEGINVVLADDGITYTVTSTGKLAIDSNLTFVEKNDNYDLILLPIKVTSTWVTLNLKFDDALASEIATLSVKYSTSAGSKEAEATIAEDKKTATVLLDSSIYQSDWKGFNLVLTAKDDSDAKIDLEYQGWINYEGTVAELTVAKYVEKTVAIAFTFEGFEIPGGSLFVKYGHNQDNEDESDDNYTDVEATVAEDGKSAVAQFSTNYAKGEYFNGITVTAKDAEDNEIEGINLSQNWLQYTTTTSITLTKPSEEELAKWTVLKSSDETFAGKDSFANYVDATEFADLTITELKVEVANYAGSEWWASINCAEIWSDETGLALPWDENIKGYSTTITDAALIESYIDGGVYIAGGNGGTAKVTVSYASE